MNPNGWKNVLFDNDFTINANNPCKNVLFTNDNKN